MGRFAAILLTTFVLIFFAERGRACDEFFILDKDSVQIPGAWCGRKVDSTNIPEPGTLRKLPDSLAENDYRIFLTPAARDAFVKMAAAAAKDSIKLMVRSGFRSIGYQKKLIKKRLKTGQKMALVLSYVAPPGYSQHHTGNAVDLAVNRGTFADTKAYQWLQENAAKFGFIETYPKENKQRLPWEPWHWYFTGVLLDSE